MAEQKYLPIEEMDMFRDFVEVASIIWQLVHLWEPLARDTVGKQVIRSADSVGANLVEGDGRYSDADALHFFMIARASARETRYWISVAKERRLITCSDADSLTDRITVATKRLNVLIRYRRATKNIGQIREDQAAYEV